MTLYYHSVQNSLSFRLLTKKVKLKYAHVNVLPVVLYGCESSFLRYGKNVG